jgi:hypothetical protein
MAVGGMCYAGKELRGACNVFTIEGRKQSFFALSHSLDHDDNVWGTTSSEGSPAM